MTCTLFLLNSWLKKREGHFTKCVHKNLWGRRETGHRKFKAIGDNGNKNLRRSTAISTLTLLRCEGKALLADKHRQFDCLIAGQPLMTVPPRRRSRMFTLRSSYSLATSTQSGDPRHQVEILGSLKDVMHSHPSS